MIEFTEIREFGVNMLALSFVATMVFTVLQAIAFLKQNQRIIQTKSGQSVSFSFYSFFGFSALAVTVFGLTNQSLALSINGLLGILSLIITANLLRFKKISKKEIILGSFSVLALPAMIFSPNRDIIFLILGLIIGVTIGTQIFEIWKNKSSGAYHPTQIFVSIVSCSFWLIYSIIMNIWAMEITNSLFLLLWFVLLFSYLKFKNK
ncbi:MAG: hypothetical protein PHW82_17470 [Bacteroidales bacterium]|nr:hypothetical protein [Bacteroidales bacterium]